MSLKIDNGESGKYFSVRKVLKIGGKKHIPSVCYPITDDITGTVDELVANKLAQIFDEKVRFMSGRPVTGSGASAIEEPQIVYPSPKVHGADEPEAKKASKASKKTGDGEFAAETSQALS